MKVLGLCRALGVLGLLAVGAAARAQAPPNYNYDRAYRHFLTSRYSARILYSSSPGSVAVYADPFRYQRQFIEPGYSRQWITPYGYGRYDAVPGFGGSAATPFGYGMYYVPGFGHGYFAPREGPPVEFYSP